MMRMLIGCQSSAACYCFCPMCLVTRDDIKEGRIHSPSILHTYNKHKRNSRLSFAPRTTSHQHELYNLYQQRGHGYLSVAKDYGNVIHPPLISTEIHQHLAALPLHILLGTTEQLLQQLEEKWYTSQGYFSRQLDDVITSLKVKRQRYHGGAFVGNDCVRLLKGRDLIANVLKPQQFESLDGKNKHIVGSNEQAQLARDLLSRLFFLHSLYSLARPLCDHEVDELTSKCHEFGCWFPVSFPKHRITPKMHVMIYHMPELAARYRTVGMFSEHAGEAIHTVFNKLNRQYVYLGSDLKRLDSVISRCLRLHDPCVLEFVQPRRVKHE
jgi:hypothetical protein